MKLLSAFIASIVVGCVLVAAQILEPTQHEVKYADRAFLQKQKFLLEILHRLESPLLFAKYLNYAADFHFDKNDFVVYDEHMVQFETAYKAGYILPRGEFFGALVKSHMTQVWGLFNYFYYAKDFEAFMHVASWARMHVSEGMFVAALTLAVIHRDDFEGLMLPPIYEILPQHFFTSKLIYETEKFDYNMWIRQIMYEKEYKDFLYQENRDAYKQHAYIYTKDWKTWQWWKMMGLGEQWYTEDMTKLADIAVGNYKTARFSNMAKGTRIFTMPTDYTRNIEYYNEHSKLSYFTEDVDWNSYWYYANMDYAYFMNSTKYNFAADRRGEHWANALKTMLTRYQWERLSQELGETPEYSAESVFEHGYNPQLISYNGIQFGYRQNDFDYMHYTDFDQFNRFIYYYKRVTLLLEKGHFMTKNGTFIDLRRPESIEVMANFMEGNADLFDSHFAIYWRIFSHMYFAGVDANQLHVLPHIFVNHETMFRDPFTYSYYKRFYQVIYKFNSLLPAYTRDELLLPGVRLTDVQVSELMTYFDFSHFDVSTLLNDETLFIEDTYVFDKIFLARQQRLNHKPFTLDYTIEAEQPQKVVVRAFLGPCYDQNRRALSLAEYRENFIEIDEFIYELVAGKNTIKRDSRDFYWTIDDRRTYAELYHAVIIALGGEKPLELNVTQQHWGFPDRLLLPQGWAKGYPMQLFFFVAPYTGPHVRYPSYEHSSFSGGVGSGKRYIDNKPFDYPFDRPIIETEFLVPNMFMKNVKVYHELLEEKYQDGKYENYGTFDYTYKENN
ncbi:larval serum protein 1 beta chain [Ceratitis capitata]|uniref:larval serum protein 1 beta chain n=1 Tax=Ceratitis capitata TaxID=7213 RepID=UPI0003299F50|nr:larval serum protein 1 beta chain [Ceratitis capitata]